MADTPETLTMTLADGDVTIKLRPDLAPQHVDRGSSSWRTRDFTTAWCSTA